MLEIFENIFLCIVMGGLCLLAVVGFIIMVASAISAAIRYFEEKKEKTK